VGWRTTDADEIALRRERASSELMRIENLEPSEPLFSTFAVRSPSGARYGVEVRSLSERENSCSCPDFRTNGLATCKHVEAVIARLRRTPAGRAALERGGRSTRVEVFMRRSGGEPAVACVLPERKLPAAVAAILGRYVGRDGNLEGDPAEAVPALVRDLDGHRAAVRIGSEVVLWATDRARCAVHAAERQKVEDELRSGRRSLPALKLPLYPYQIDGMLHLAFTERALLGDEMGLGKTAQAVAACMLLRELRGIARVLVVCPVSLKAEWEEQITKFTDLPLRLVQGTKPARLACYEAPAFFTIANYEQVMRDVGDVNQRLRPDVVILDMRMPKASGAELLAELREKLLGIRVLVITASQKPETLLDAISAGADGFLTKRVTRAELCEAVLKVHSGGTVLPPEIASQVLREFGVAARRDESREQALLTPREEEVLRLVADGLTDKQIAERLFVSPRTVQSHLAQVRQKTGLARRSALARWAGEHILG
jgi:DNA-binding NarL/FixJ family response regulator